MKNTDTNAQAERPARQPDTPSLFKLMTRAEARHARRVAYAAALDVIG